MSPEEARDRALEPWLRRSVPAGGTGMVSPECLDAETLAAWAEGTLTAREVTTIEAHVAGCSHCQAMAAAMIRATPIEAPALPWWRRSLRATWLVPLTAGAAAVVLWVVVPGQREVSQPSQVATTALADRQPAEESKAGGPNASAASRQERAAAEPPKLKEANPPSAAITRQPFERSRADTVEGARAAADERREAAPGKDQPRAASERPRDTLAGAAPIPAAPAPAAVAAPRPEPTAVGAARARPNENAADALLAKRVATTRELTVVGTPGLRWRFGVGGSIERSDDEGKSWVAQKSGVTAELLAGACPSPTTCWIVGRNGTVLRTADGQTWSRTTSPDGLDLVGVQASDDRTAIVSTAASGRFRTADAGQTWVRVSPQDF